MPESVATDGYSESFVRTREKLDDILGEQNKRVMELSISATQGVNQALTRLEEATRHTRNVVE